MDGHQRHRIRRAGLFLHFVGFFEQGEVFEIGFQGGRLGLPLFVLGDRGDEFVDVFPALHRVLEVLVNPLEAVKIADFLQELGDLPRRGRRVRRTRSLYFA